MGKSMSPIPASIHDLAQGVRAHGPILLAGTQNPHDELMSLVWGPRFDREHALRLLARQPQNVRHTLPALLAAADYFDALRAPAQSRLRRLILRHRASCAVGERAAVSDAPSTASDFQCLTV